MQRHELEKELYSAYRNILDICGQKVCVELTFQIAGAAPRSHLEVITEPLKKLILHHPMSTKKWLTHALESSGFPSQKVIPDQRRIWLQKIMKSVTCLFTSSYSRLTQSSSLRGGKQTLTVTKDFWVQCMGDELGYI